MKNILFWSDWGVPCPGGLCMAGTKFQVSESSMTRAVEKPVFLTCL